MTSTETTGAADATASVPGCFRTTTRVSWDELDVLGVLHHARFVVHAERAFTRMLDAMGFPYDPDHGRRPERHHVVVGIRLDFAHAIDRPGLLEIEQRVVRLGRTSLTVGFTMRMAEGGPVAAEGVRTVVHIDRATRRPQAWSPRFTEQLRNVLRHDAGGLRTLT